MKNILFAYLLLFSLIACSKNESHTDAIADNNTVKDTEQAVYMFSYFKGNGEDGVHLAYSMDAKKWTALNNDQSFLTPVVGENKLMRDPCVIQGPDSLYHMVWTVSWNGKGIGYANSADLISWSDQLYIPVMQHEERAKNCWAPEIFYDNDSELYLIYWSTTIPGRYPETDESAKNRNNHRIYYTTTKDFKTFSDTKLLYNQGFNVIDATLHKVGEDYVMFLKNETLYPNEEKNIRIATSKSLYGGYSQASEPITKNWVEGPTAIKTENGWVVYFDQYNEGKMGAIISSDLKTWIDISDEISFPKGTRHGSVFKVTQRVLNDLLMHK